MNSRRAALGVAAALLALTAGVFVTRSAVTGGIDLPGTQPTDGSGDPNFPRFNNNGFDGFLQDPLRCASCHSAYRQFNEKVYEPFDSWAGSMMANSARDPLFWAALDIANRDAKEHLGGAGVGDLCLRCHVPKGWYEGRSTCETAYGEKFDGACFVGTRDAPGGDLEGIQCQYCHRMYDAGNPPPNQVADPAAPYLQNAEVYLTDEPNTMQGPYSDAQPPRHTFTASAFIKQSAFCGQCHNVTHPALNQLDAKSGADLGFKFPIERTYREWSNSVYAQEGHPKAATCQACHMPAADTNGDGTTDDAAACAYPPGLRGENTALQGPVRTHFFRGPSTFMMQVLQGEFGVLLERSTAFDAALEQSRKILANTATVTVNAPTLVNAGRRFQAIVTVTNLSGHKFPTGYSEGRRAFLRVSAGPDRDANGVLDPSEVTFVSGAIDPATGGLVPDAQLRVYEVKHGIFNWNGTGTCDTRDANGREMFHFVLNNCIVKDNRIPPLGFVPDPETVPVGATFLPDPAIPGALQNKDRASYAIPVPLVAHGTLLVQAELLYQSIAPEYVDFLLAENTSTCDPLDAPCDPTQPDDRPNRAEKMKDVYERYGRSTPELLASATAATRIRPLRSGAVPVRPGIGIR